MKQSDYTSIGVGFGHPNIEFICFKVHFGLKNTHFSGFGPFIVFSKVDNVLYVIICNGVRINVQVGNSFVYSIDNIHIAD